MRLPGYRVGTRLLWLVPSPMQRHVYSQTAASTNRRKRPSGEKPTFGVDLPPNPQRYYDIFLNKKFHRRQPHELTSTWLNLPEPRKTDEALPTWLHGPPRILEDTNADLHTVVGVLEDHIAGLHHAHGSKEEVRAAFSSQNIGVRALRWLLVSRAYDQTDLLQAPAFLKLLAHSMVGQGAEDHLWQFLHTKETLLIDKRLRNPAMWKSVLLTHLVWARMFWLADDDAFGAGLQALLQGIAPSKALRQRRGELFINVRLAGSDLTRFLGAVDSVHIKASDFETFRAKSFIWGQAHDEFRPLFLETLHPSGQNPWPAVAFLRKYRQGFSKNPELYDRIGRSHTRGALALFMFLVKTAKALNDKGHPADARWVIDFGRAHCSYLFREEYEPRRTILRRALPIRRRPTPHETRQGIPLDSNGFVAFAEILDNVPAIGVTPGRGGYRTIS